MSLLSGLIGWEASYYIIATETVLYNLRKDVVSLREKYQIIIIIKSIF